MNPVRFLHTADLQLGMPFRWVSGDRGAKLREMRLEIVDRLITLVQETGAAFVLIAGDLFDANTVSDRVVHQACARFSEADRPIVVIPGNHDHAGPDSVYRRRAFVDNRPPMMTVCDSHEPLVLLKGVAVVLPAPLSHRALGADPTREWSADLGREGAAEAVRIGLAHGSVSGFGSWFDEEAVTSGSASEAPNLGAVVPNPIDLDCVERADLDYLALGDWHGTRELGPRAWYSGAPEPTRFKDREAGYVLLVEVAGHGALPSVRRIPFARSRWLRRAAQLYTRDDVAELEGWFASLESPLETLVMLESEGRLSLADLDRFERLCQRMEGQLLALRLSGPGVMPSATPEELDGIAADGYVRLAIERLQAQSEGAADEEEAATAARALQLLHRFAGEGQDNC